MEFGTGSSCNFFTLKRFFTFDLFVFLFLFDADQNSFYGHDSPDSWLDTFKMDFTRSF